MNAKWKLVLAAAGGLMLMASAHSVRAQDAGSMLTASHLYVDKTTGQVFIKPGRNRIPLKMGGAVDTQAIEEQVEQKVEERTTDKMRAAVAEARTQAAADNAATAKQLADMKPAWSSYVANFQNKFRIGTLVYLDYGLYTHTGFGPQFSENQNPPGPGNNFFNSFDVSRVYLNIYFSPTDQWTFRFTPEVYRANGTASNDTLGQTASSGPTLGSTSAVGTNVDNDMNVRMKYAYVQYNQYLDDIPALKGGTITLGAQGNPFIPWEEDLYQYRFVNLVPWNYISLSSSQIGLQFSGPIKGDNGEKTYVDYGFGVYDNGSFRSQEQTNTKQVMAKATIYPLGAKWRYEGFGMTGFYNYGWGNTTPESVGISTPLKGSYAHFERIAALLHYSAEQWNIAGEFDYGNNAFNLGNLYSGSGPLDAFCTATGLANTKKSPFLGNTCSAAAPCYNVYGTYGPQVAAYRAFLQNGRARELGWDAFGHYQIPGTKLTAFGMFQWFLPNDNVTEDPLDFQRFVVGLSYQFNEYVRLAFDSQNLLFYHSQFGLPVSKISKFGYIPGSSFNGRKLPTSVPTTAPFTGVIPNLVPRDTHALFLNLEFAY